MKLAAVSVMMVLAVMLIGCVAPPGANSGNSGNGTGLSEQRTGVSGAGVPLAQGGGNTQGQATNSTGTEETADTPETATTGASDGTKGMGQETGNDTSGQTTSQTAGKTSVLMLGRSVAYGWSEYMGLQWQEDESYVGEYDGKTFRYLHMDYPPDIDDSAIRAMETYDYDVVFFKLCFVDFGSGYGDMLADDKQYVQNVYNEAVVMRHKKLIVGNALPQVSRDTTTGLKQNHLEYNRWLSEFASTHEDVYVLDLYGMLADSSGSLKSGYATSYEDSHPNSAGYDRITPAFMDKIEEATGD
jgi:hypothetical protein